MRKVMLIFGTRPEAIKLCPLVKQLQRRPAFDVRVCVTGQHRQMLDQVLEAFGVTPDVNLGVMRPEQDLTGLTAAILAGVQQTIRRQRPDLVLVQGDTTTAFAAALAAFYERSPVAHVEAGLRTFDMDRPWPEEFDRRAVSLIARYHFAPTRTARQNLLAEGVPPERVYVTGNTAIDALRTTVREDYVNPILDAAAHRRLLLITAHRRESLGAPLEGMLRAIRRAVEERPDVMAVYPVHMNSRVRETAGKVLGDCPQVCLTGPMDPVDFHNVMARCHLVVTDSGGIQEEAPSLGKPVLVMRDATERPEGVRAGTLLLTGTSEQGVYRALTRLLDDPSAYEAMERAVNPYGDGHASERIADVLEQI